MAETEGYFEKLSRLISEERQEAAIRLLKRCIAEGKFPDNEDTVAAFAAGFYGYIEYRAASKKASEGSQARPFAILAFMFGGVLLTCLGFVYFSVPGGLAPQAIYAPFAVIACIAGGVLLWRRANRREKEIGDAFKAEWGR